MKNMKEYDMSKGFLFGIGVCLVILLFSMYFHMFPFNNFVEGDGVIDTRNEIEEYCSLQVRMRDAEVRALCSCDSVVEVKDVLVKVTSLSVDNSVCIIDFFSQGGSDGLGLVRSVVGDCPDVVYKNISFFDSFILYSEFNLSRREADKMLRDVYEKG